MNKLEQAGRLNEDHVIIDSNSVRVMHHAKKTRKNLTDRAAYGTNRYMLTNAYGLVLNVKITGSHPHDLNHAKDVIRKPPRVRARRSQCYHKPKRLLGDQGYDLDSFRQWLGNQEIDPLIARRANLCRDMAVLPIILAEITVSIRYVGTE